MANEEKKTVSDVKPKSLKVTWFATHEALMNPGLPHITSYMRGNPNMHGKLDFTWIPGSHYLQAMTEEGTMAICPIVNFKSFSVTV